MTVPYEGKYELKTFFAWWPVTICGERRWMERVTVYRVADYYTNISYTKRWYWRDVGFVDNGEDLLRAICEPDKEQAGQ